MLSRRDFVKVGGMATATVLFETFSAIATPFDGKRVGIIGLDTSHSLAFTKLLAEDDIGIYQGYKVVAAYPFGSKTLELSNVRIPLQIEEIKKYGVHIVDSISELLKEVDVILLETNDGRIHLEQALEVIKAKKSLFIDKPIAASVRDAEAIFKAAEKYSVPIFSSSSLRFMDAVYSVRAGTYGEVIGAETFSPATLEKTHPDLFWYGIHGVETLFAVMGPNCKKVTRYYTDDTDIVIGIWDEDRIGTFRGIRKGKADFGGTAFCESGIVNLGPYLGYSSLLKEIVAFFETKSVPVPAVETLSILAFMEAADESKRLGGKTVSMRNF